MTRVSKLVPYGLRFRLVPGGTNMGLLKISFSVHFNLKKSQVYSIRANLTQYKHDSLMSCEYLLDTYTYNSTFTCSLCVTTQMDSYCLLTYTQICVLVLVVVRLTNLVLVLTDMVVCCIGELLLILRVSR